MSDCQADLLKELDDIGKMLRGLHRSLEDRLKGR
jgi:hypothetical protein